MYKVLYVSQLAHNLFSVRAAASKGNLVRFRYARCWISYCNRKLTGMGTVVDKLYQLDCEAVCSEQASVAIVKIAKFNEADIWHFRLSMYVSKQPIKI